MKKFVLIILMMGGFWYSLPVINKHLIKHDLVIVPKNILKKKNPLVRSISGFEADFVRGEVYSMKENNEMVIIKKGDHIDSLDTIYVRGNSFAILKFGFDSRIKINSNSILKLKDFKKILEKYDYSRINKIELEMGSVLVDYQNYSDDVSLEITTKRAAMGVRGTQFIAAMGFSDQGLRVAVNHGLVEMKNILNNESIMVSDQEGAIISAKGKITEPKNHSWNKTIDWNLENSSLETPEQFDQIQTEAIAVKLANKKKQLESLNQFKPSEDAITNANLNQKLDEANNTQMQADNDVANSKDANELDSNVAKYEKTDDEILAELESDDYKKQVMKMMPKINQGVLMKFSQKGLVPNKLQVAMEEIKSVEEKNANRLKELDSIGEE